MEKKKIILPIVALMSIGIGFLSAKMIEKIQQPNVNIFQDIAKENSNIKIIGNNDSLYLFQPIKIKGELTFAGERVPLEDAEIMERLDRELQVNAYWQSNTILSMKLSNRYFDLIGKILQEEGVPADFVYLPLIESGFRDVVSPAGAAGFWQFIPETGRRYGLEINDIVDERYNIEKATRAACQMLKSDKEKLGSWTAAAAAYNVGVNGIQNKMSQQKMTSYYDLLLNQETSRYVFRMLAMKIIYTAPQQAGFKIEEDDLYKPFQYKTIQIDSSIADLADFAIQNGIKYKELKMLNSWMRNTSLSNKSKKVYDIKILSL